MTTALAPVGSIGYDAAGFVSVDCVDRACDVGDWLSLYLGGNYGVARAQIETVWRHGKGVMMNWERSSNQALKGYTDGILTAQSVARGGTALALPFDQVPIAVIVSGVDFGATTSQFSVMDDWHHGLVDQARIEGIRCGYYGYTAYGDHLTALGFWPQDWPNWQWAGAGSIRPWATVKQKYGSYTRDISQIGCAVDENVVVRPLPLWTGDGVDDAWEPVSIPWCRNEALHGTHDWTFHCLEMCRVSWGIPTPVFPDAYSAWKGSHQRFDAPPAGAPVYWTNIIHDAAGRELGHIAIQDWDPAYCWSIDLMRKGKVDRVPKDLVRTKWGGQYLGWTTDLEHVTLDLYPPLPPQEDDMTPDELHAIVDPQLSALTVQVAELQKTLTGDFGNGVSMHGAAQGAYDLLRLDKHQFLDAVVAATAKQVLAGLPPSSNGYTLDQITAAFEAVINRTHLGVA